MKVFIFFILVGLSLCDESSSVTDPLDCVRNYFKYTVPENTTDTINATCKLINNNTDENRKIYISAIGNLTNCTFDQAQVNASELQEIINPSLLNKLGVNTNVTCNMVKDMNSRECADEFGREIMKCVAADKMDAKFFDCTKDLKVMSPSMRKRSILSTMLPELGKRVDNATENTTNCIIQAKKNMTDAVKDFLNKRACCNKESGLINLCNGESLTVQELTTIPECAIKVEAGLQKQKLEALYEILNKLLNTSWKDVKRKYGAVCPMEPKTGQLV